MNESKTRKLCSVDGCSNVMKGWHRETREPICVKHYCGHCAVDGCSNWCDGVDGVCRTHRRNGLDYVVARGGELEARSTDVYLILLPNDCVKIGITSTNRPESIAERNHGESIRLGTWSTKSAARRVEQLSLRLLDELGLQHVDPTICESTMDGWTEWRQADDVYHRDSAVLQVQWLVAQHRELVAA